MLTVDVLEIDGDLVTDVVTVEERLRDVLLVPVPETDDVRLAVVVEDSETVAVEDLDEVIEPVIVTETVDVLELEDEAVIVLESLEVAD